MREPSFSQLRCGCHAEPGMGCWIALPTALEYKDKKALFRANRRFQIGMFGSHHQRWATWDLFLRDDYVRIICCPEGNGRTFSFSFLKQHLCSPGCPGAPRANQAGLQFRDLPTFWMLGLKLCGTMPGWKGPGAMHGGWGGEEWRPMNTFVWSINHKLIMTVYLRQWSRENQHWILMV